MNIIVAFAKSSDLQTFKSILTRSGYSSIVTCSSGAQALSAMESLGSGVVICGYRLNDMLYSELLEDLPECFQMLLIASTSRAPAITSADNFIYLPAPVNKEDFFSTLSMMLEGVSVRRRTLKEKRRARTEADKKVIEQAKALLMERHHMTEPEAHKYLQKCSMDSGTAIIETAEMIISLSNI